MIFEEKLQIIRRRRIADAPCTLLRLFCIDHLFYKAPIFFFKQLFTEKKKRGKEIQKFLGKNYLKVNNKILFFDECRKVSWGTPLGLNNFENGDFTFFRGEQ